MEVAFLAAATALSAYNQYQTGKFQRTAYRLQAQQEELKGRAEALQFSQKATSLLEVQRRTSAALVARAAAGGINPFTGSPMTVDQYNAYQMGEEYNILDENADIAIAAGFARSQSLQAAGDQAYRSGKIGAITTIAMGAYQGSKLMSPGGGTPIGGGKSPLDAPMLQPTSKFDVFSTGNFYPS